MIQELTHPATGVVYFGYGPDFYVKIDIGESKLRWESTTPVEVDLPRKAVPMTDQTPKEAGWYFAQHIGWNRPEPVELFDTSLIGGLRVRVAGYSKLFHPDVFTWGPRITLPTELEKKP